jgi:hypothetical protein
MAASAVEQQADASEAWAAFCDTLKRAGAQILRPEAASDPLSRAEGYRYLTRLLRIGLEMHLEFADPDFPGFFAPSHETAKIGADNPDNLYQMARLKGRNEYLIRGQRGSVPYLSFGTQKGGYETNGRMEQTGFLDAAEIAVDAGGHFEILLSQTRQPGNWLKLEPESNALIVRQTFLDRRHERPATLSIQRRGADSFPQPLSPQALATGLGRAAAFVEGTAGVFANWAQSYLKHVNQLPPADQALCQSAGGDPNIHYYHSCWELAEDEALLIELPRIPVCRFWNFQLNNWWMESLDYRHHRISVNQHSARLNADGSARLVVAHRDPGTPNWLDTAGHRRGTMCLRWVGASEHVDPRTRVCKLAELEPSR